MNTRGIYLLLALSALLARLNARSERGGVAVEYGLLLATVATLAGLFLLLGDNLETLLHYHCDNNRGWRCSP